ncbi:MAG: TlpA disulfide reductase family protein [Zavarzinella sp.]
MKNFLMMIAFSFCWQIDAPSASADDVKLEKVTFEQLKKAVESHKGKVVVLDIWGTFCPPCKAKYPHLVAMHHKLKDKGLVIISLSVDFTDEEKDVVDFLQSQKAVFPNYLLDDSEENKVKWDKIWQHNSLPAIHIFGKDGTKVESLIGEKAGKMLDEIVEKHLVVK